MIECLKCGNRNPANFSYGSITSKDGTSSDLSYRNPLGAVVEQVLECRVCSETTFVEYRITLKSYTNKP